MPPAGRRGPLGVPLLGALLVGGSSGNNGSGNNGGGGHALSLHAPLIVAAAGYVIAVGLAWFATRPER